MPVSTDGWKSAARFVLSAIVVLSVYGLWLFKTYQQMPVNPLVVVIALVVAIAAASVVFGKRRLGNAFDMVSEARGLAEEMRQMKEDSGDE